MSWRGFTGTGRYGTFMDLAITHGLDTPIMEALSAVGAFSEKQQQEFVQKELNELAVEHGWKYESENFYVKHVDWHVLHGNEGYFIVSILKHLSTYYEWKQGYNITRNGVRISLEQLLVMLAIDVME